MKQGNTAVPCSKQLVGFVCLHHVYMEINKKQNADFSNTRVWFVDTVQHLRLKRKTVS